MDATGQVANDQCEDVEDIYNEDETYTNELSQDEADLHDEAFDALLECYGPRLSGPLGDPVTADVDPWDMGPAPVSILNVPTPLMEQQHFSDLEEEAKTPLYPGATVSRYKINLSIHFFSAFQKQIGTRMRVLVRVNIGCHGGNGC
jgi:hypothetical protein